MSLLSLAPQDPQIREWLYAELKSWTKSIECNHPGIQTVYLFGSIASGMATAESDLDIAVITDDCVDRHSIPRPLKGKFPVDFVVLKRFDFEARKGIGGICFEIAATGVEIFPHWRWIL